MNVDQKITASIADKKIIQDNPDKPLPGADSFISVDPSTGARTEASTSQQDIKNRQAFSEKTGIPVEEVTTPPPKPLVEKTG